MKPTDSRPRAWVRQLVPRIMEVSRMNVTSTNSEPPNRLSLPDIRRAAARALDAGHFFLRDGVELEWDHQELQEISWELHHGRLLDASQTRERRTFETWSVFLIEDGVRVVEPLLSVKRDDGCLHVVRAILSHAWEGYDSGDGVFLSRKSVKWLRELVGSLDAADFTSVEEFQAELGVLLFQAVVGTSRLPLTSLEAPLPSFSLGGLGYFPSRPGLSPKIGDGIALLEEGLSIPLADRELPKLLELALRAVPLDDIPRLSEIVVRAMETSGREPEDLLAVFRRMFNDIALSPYTDFVDNSLALLRLLAERGTIAKESHADLLCFLLRQLGRHLTAYDLKTFHHRGANYPDALFLDALLRELLQVVHENPDLLRGPTARLRRRGLRAGWLLRAWYRGLPVPAAPTSPGENQRVFPPKFVQVSEEEILNPASRSKRLFHDAVWPVDAFPLAILQECIADLEQESELRELGVAIFLDRPLGKSKHPVEPDATPLLAYETFSKQLALDRLGFLERTLGLVDGQTAGRLRERLRQEAPGLGKPLMEHCGKSRPGVVSLADALLAAPDWVLVRTLPRSARDFLKLFNFQSLDARSDRGWLDDAMLVVGFKLDGGKSRHGIAIFDANGRKRLALRALLDGGYVLRGGVELPRDGLEAVGMWDETGQPIPAAELRVPVRIDRRES